MTESRFLIVNADDFGLAPGVNRGIIAAHEEGIVTSASLMVRWPSAVQAAAYGRAHPRLSIGLHVDLGEWAFRDGAWATLYEVVPANDRSTVLTEVARQLESFRRLLGRDPTHLDSHQHIHREEPVRSVLTALAADLGVPLRHFHPRICYSGDFYGQDGKGTPFPDSIGVESLLRLLRSLPSGTTELGCHPGEGEDVDSTYRSERADERRTLCDPRIRAALEEEHIRLCSFTDWAAISSQ